MYDADFASKFATGEDQLCDFCKSLATGAHKISEFTWETVTDVMRDEQANHHEGGVHWRNEPWPVREYTPKLVKKAWSHLTSDEIKSLHLFGDSEFPTSQNEGVSSCPTFVESQAADKQDANSADAEFWDGDFSDSEISNVETFYEDTFPTALLPGPSKTRESGIAEQLRDRPKATRGLAELMTRSRETFGRYSGNFLTKEADGSLAGYILKPDGKPVFLIDRTMNKLDLSEFI